MGGITDGCITSQAVPNYTKSFAAAVAVVAADVLAGAVEAAVAVVALVVLVVDPLDVELATVAWTTCPSALKTMLTSVPSASYL